MLITLTGFGKAIIGLAQKIVIIICYLITKDEFYEDETGYGKNYFVRKRTFETISLVVDEIIQIYMR